MTRILTAILTTTLALSGSALAADACCPSDAAKSAAATTVSEPAAKQMPPGHPPMGGSGKGMPPGHPPMNAQAPSEPFAAELVVKVVQGTSGATLDKLPVTVEFYQGGQVAKTETATTNDKGVAMFESVQVPGNVQPLISVEHAGVKFQAVGKMMTSQVADQMVRVTVFEPTEDEPAWEVAMRHVMVEPMDGALKVSEVIAVRNPGDRAWVGKKVQAKSEGDPQRVTLTFTLPDGARHVKLARGFHPDFSRGQENTITCWMPMLPGASEFHYSYVVAAKDGKVDLALLAPAITRHMMLFLPQSVEASSTAASKTFPAGDHEMRLFEWKDLAGGQNATVSITGLGVLGPAIKSPGQRADAGEETPQQPASVRGARAIAGLGAGALVLGGVVVMMLKPRAAQR